MRGEGDSAEEADVRRGLASVDLSPASGVRSNLVPLKGKPLKVSVESSASLVAHRIQDIGSDKEEEKNAASSPSGIPLFSQLFVKEERQEDEYPVFPSLGEKSGTLKSAASDRRLRKSEDSGEDELLSDAADNDDGDEYEEDDMEGYISRRTSSSRNTRLALKIDIIAGPASEFSFTADSDIDTVTLGRAPGNSLTFFDAEVSGKHAIIAWCFTHGCWKITDQGSLNGTYLNGDKISMGHKVVGEEYRLNSDDMIQLGSSTKMKISLMPEEMVNVETRERRQSLSKESFPKTLTMPKHKAPSFNSLLSPIANSSPSSNAVVAASSAELRLECSIVSCTGREHSRRKQPIEDIACVECPLIGPDNGYGDTYAALFCVFDGHCGRSAAEAASTALPEEISMRLMESMRRQEEQKLPNSVDDILHDAFLATDDRIADEAGCTATSILVWRSMSDEDVLYVQGANVGDSMAFILDFDTSSYSLLTEDHRLSNPDERARLEQTGIPLGKDTRRLYGLNLARALGDRFLKDEDLGLSADPSTSGRCKIPKDKNYIIIIASDGLWDVMSPSDAAKLVIRVERESYGGTVDIASALVRQAQQLGSRDDITALVVRIWSRNEWEDRQLDSTDFY